MRSIAKNFFRCSCPLFHGITLNLMQGELSYTLIENIHTKFEKTLNYTSRVKLNLFLLKIVPKRTNIIVRCICRHPDNNIDGFNTNYLMPLLLKLSKEFYLVTLINNSCSPICSF